MSIKEVHAELLANCARRIVLYGDNEYDETCLHKSINPLFGDTKYWKNRGWCSVKCGSLNWPHRCDFCVKCNGDRSWCICK
jgi:hypothetical protein